MSDINLKIALTYQIMTDETLLVLWVGGKVLRIPAQRNNDFVRKNIDGVSCDVDRATLVKALRDFADAIEETAP